MKKIFADFNELEHRLQELYYKLDVIQNKLYSIRGVSYEPMFKNTSRNDNTVYNIAKKDEISKEIAETSIKRNEVYKKHIEQINQISNERFRCILRCWYLDKLNAQQIADILQISISHMFKLKKEAVKEFKKLYYENDSK